MPGLPTGTVTFLFTDIEGSTQLAQAHPAEWEAARQRHHTILRAAAETQQGYVFQVVGDAFCVAFHNASDAVAAALDAQRTLQSTFNNPEATIIRVRMGLHSGPAEAREGDYLGYLTLAQVQRVMSAAYGGQVLVSNTTAALVSGQIPAGLTLRDLGEHRLKGLLNPEHLWQLVASDLPADFPPLQSLNAIPNNLPIQVTSFVGRERELDELKERLPTTRLLTLTGSGGTGKTRLSLQVAAEVLNPSASSGQAFKDGVWFIELAPLSDPALVPITVASVVGVREEPGHALMATLLDWLRPKQLLFILDNCEHLIEACAKFADAVLHASRETRILASSREALGIAGELAWRVPSLACPDPHDVGAMGLAAAQGPGTASGGQPHPLALRERPGRSPTPKDLGLPLQDYAAIRLFVERAKFAHPAFAVTDANAPVVAQICYRLDGIPLAIELAAARVKAMRVEQIAERLDDRFRLLTGGSRTALPRQQTLRSLIDWSHSLLSEPERIVLRRLSVFAGGWTLEAAEAVCADVGHDDILPPGGQDAILSYDVLDLLTRLVDKSLVVLDEQAEEPRYRMLETIRQYAREKMLESGEADRVRGYHLDFYARLADAIAPKLLGGEAAFWLNKLDRELDNLRAALNWALDARAIETGLRMVTMLKLFWQQHCHSEEALRRLRELLAQPEAATQTIARAKALYAAGDLEAWSRNNANGAQPLLEEALAIAEALAEAELMINCRLLLAVVAQGKGNNAVARSLIERSLSDIRATGITKLLPFPLQLLGDLAFVQNEYERARLLYEECLVHAREQEQDIEIAYVSRRLGQVQLEQGNNQTAFRLILESMTLNRKLGDVQAVAACLAAMGAVAKARSLSAKATTLFGAVSAILQTMLTRLLVTDQEIFEHKVSDLRASLGEAAFDAAWEAGRKLTLEQAIALALESVDE